MSLPIVAALAYIRSSAALHRGSDHLRPLRSGPSDRELRSMRGCGIRDSRVLTLGQGLWRTRNKITQLRNKWKDT